MIIDTSAIIAILRDEPEAMSCARAIADATIRRISAVNFVESAVVIDASRDPIATRRFDDFIREAGIAIEPVTKFKRRSREMPTEISEEAVGIRLSSISATALPMRLQKSLVNRCCSKAMISPTQTSLPFNSRAIPF